MPSHRLSTHLGCICIIVLVVDGCHVLWMQDKAAAAAELDAMFEDEDDDGDYDPSAADPLAEDASGVAMTGAQQELADVTLLLLLSLPASCHAYNSLSIDASAYRITRSTTVSLQYHGEQLIAQTDSWHLVMFHWVVPLQPLLCRWMCNHCAETQIEGGYA